MIEIQDLHFTYPDGRKAISGINLVIEPGEKVGLIGPNGAGKSTFLYHLNGVLSGTGKIKIKNLVLNKKNIPYIRAIIGLVFQNPDDQLFSSSVYEDVAYGPLYQGLEKNEVNDRVEIALDQVHMKPYLNRNSYHLSVGEKKRIAIATVLSMQPEILVLDEPTAGLDPKGRREFIDLLLTFPQTMIIASHDLDLVERTTERVVILSEGQIRADGSTKEILTNNKLLIACGLA